MNVSEGREETEQRLAAFRAGVRRRLAVVVVVVVVRGAVVGNADKGFRTGVIVVVFWRYWRDVMFLSQLDKKIEHKNRFCDFFE